MSGSDSCARICAYKPDEPDFREAFRELDRAQAVAEPARWGWRFDDLTDVRLGTAEVQLLSARSTALGQRDDSVSEAIKAELRVELGRATHALDQARHALADGRNDDLERELLDQIEAPLGNVRQDVERLRREPGPAAPAKADVRAHLDRAMVALDEAQASLVSRPPDVHRWTRCGLLQAHHRHERILWEVWSGRPLSEEDEQITDRIPSSAERRARAPRCEILISEGLIYLGRVKALCRRNRYRLDELRRLWLWFLTDFLILRQSSKNGLHVDNARQDWYRWNDVAGIPFVPPPQYSAGARESAREHLKGDVRKPLRLGPHGSGQARSEAAISRAAS